MNTKQIQYVLALSETLNFSQTAEQLCITQPALSKQILHIEKDLGVKLFDRNHTPLTLTPAGEYFVRNARRLSALLAPARTPTCVYPNLPSVPPPYRFT